jgi:hypothetical protein
MDKLLETGRKRRDERSGKDEDRVAERQPASSTGPDDAHGLAELVASIKRKSSAGAKGRRSAKIPKLTT